MDLSMYYTYKRRFIIGNIQYYRYVGTLPNSQFIVMSDFIFDKRR